MCACLRVCVCTRVRVCARVRWTDASENKSHRSALLCSWNNGFKMKTIKISRLAWQTWHRRTSVVVYTLKVTAKARLQANRPARCKMQSLEKLLFCLVRFYANKLSLKANTGRPGIKSNQSCAVLKRLRWVWNLTHFFIFRQSFQTLLDVVSYFHPCFCRFVLFWTVFALFKAVFVQFCAVFVLFLCCFVLLCSFCAFLYSFVPFCVVSSS